MTDVAASGPPLPRTLRAPPSLTALAAGGHFVRLTRPGVAPPLVGTLRVERPGAELAASGDLYRAVPDPGGGWSLPDLSAGPPVFPRAHYHGYLRLEALAVDATGGIRADFECYPYSERNGWSPAGPLTATLAEQPAPRGYPRSERYLSGAAGDGAGRPAGTLEIGWVSEHVRRATVEVDRVPGARFPRGNGAGLGWKRLFAPAGWHVEVHSGGADVIEPSGESWSNPELHAKMLEVRDGKEYRLDEEWLYHLLCVRLLDGAERGLMYDAAATDSNRVPREGAAIASDWRFESVPALWGRAAGERFADAPGGLYFRTAAHEIGHAMGLTHDEWHHTVMCPTNQIALDAGDRGVTFPDNVVWEFLKEDLRRLRHLPDPVVRPGMVPYRDAGDDAEAMAVHEAASLALTVTPLLPEVPLGAPVRIDLDLRNAGTEPCEVPALELSAGSVSGSVTDAEGRARAFRPLYVRADGPQGEEARWRVLRGGGSCRSSLTLLRGGRGALFPRPGQYRVLAVVQWRARQGWRRVSGQTSVTVTAAAPDADLEAVMQPDVLLALVLRSATREGVGALRRALESQTLRPHYAVIEARRLAVAPGGDLKESLSLIEAGTVLSGAEIGRVAQLIRTADPGQLGGERARVVAILKGKVAQVPTDPAIREMVEAL